MATTNKGKIQELQDLLNNSNIQVNLKTLADIPQVIPEPKENGTTFLENALIKAHYYHQKTLLPTLADDSGLIIPALNNEPGVYSARYASLKKSSLSNMDLVLHLMKNITDRKAFFFSSLVFVDNNQLLYSTSGKYYGLITENAQGKKGFGYDPIFFIPHLQKTAAQIPLSEKNLISHRGISLSKMLPNLEEWSNVEDTHDFI